MKAIMQVFQKKRKIITRYIEGDNHIKSDNQFQRGFCLHVEDIIWNWINVLCQAI